MASACRFRLEEGWTIGNLDLVDHIGNDPAVLLVGKRSPPSVGLEEIELLLISSGKLVSIRIVRGLPVGQSMVGHDMQNASFTVLVLSDVEDGAGSWVSPVIFVFLIRPFEFGRNHVSNLEVHVAPILIHNSLRNIGSVA